MKLEHSVTLLEKSNARLNIKISSEDVLKHYNQILEHLKKDAKIDGFRKGKVPSNVLEKKFLPQIQAQTIQSLIDESLKEVFRDLENQPIPNSVKMLNQDNIENFDLKSDFDFSIEYDIYPKIELKQYKEFEDLDFKKVEISDSDLQNELLKMQEQQSVSIEKKSGSVEEGDIVTVDYFEIDSSDNEVQGTKRQDFSFEVGTYKNYYHIDEELKGMSKDETRIVSKEYPVDFEFEELRDKKTRISVTLKKIRRKQIPDLDDEFAKDVDDKYNTLEDLKKDLKEKLIKEIEHINIHLKQDSLLKKISEENEVVIPQSLLNQQLNARWYSFVKNFGGREEVVINLLKEQGKDPKDVLQDWIPSVENELKTSLLVNKIIQEEGLSVTEEEVNAEIQKYIKEDNSEDAEEYFKKEEVVEEVKSHLLEHKITEFLIENSKFKEPNIISYDQYKKGDE